MASLRVSEVGVKPEPCTEELGKQISLNISIDSDRLQYLLERRLILAEELKCSSKASKVRVQYLLLQTALKQKPWQV